MLTKEELLNGAITFDSDFLTAKQRLDVELPEGFYITEEEVREALEEFDYDSEYRSQFNKGAHYAVTQLVRLLFAIDEPMEFLKAEESDLLDDSEDGEGNKPDSVHESNLLIAPDGQLHQKEYAPMDGKSIDPTEPLRVSVESKQEARELADLCTDAGFDVHWFMDLDLASHLHIEPSKNNADIWHNSDKEHDVEWNDRKPQVEKYLEFHSQEADITEQTDDDAKYYVSKMSHYEGDGWGGPTEHLTEQELKNEYPDKYTALVEQGRDFVRYITEFGKVEQKEQTDDELTHDVPDPSGAQCIYCHKTDILLSNTCPEHPDRHTTQDKQSTMSDNEDTMQDKERKIGEDDGVCEWTYNSKNHRWQSACGESFQSTHDGPEENGFQCPYCLRPIEIVEDKEDYKFEVGDLVRYKGREPIENYIITGQHEPDCDDCGCYDSRHFSALCETGGNGYIPVGKQEKFERLGAFQPTDQFFERVPEECNGSLVIDDHAGVLFDTMCRKNDFPYDCRQTVIGPEGDGYSVAGAKATGIVLSVSELESIYCEEE